MKRFPWKRRAAWWMEARITPWLRPSQETYFERVEALIQPSIRILDIGCGKEFLMDWLRPDLYRKWEESIIARSSIFGIDPYLPSLQKANDGRKICALGDAIPFANSSFDLVTANMVVEHFRDPASVLNEVTRVLKPGGAFIFHTPNLHSPAIRVSQILPHSLKQAIVPVIEGDRQKEDVFPTHYRMNTREAILETISRCGLRCEYVEHVFTSPLTGFAGPLVLFELLLIRLFRGVQFGRRRPDLVCLLRRPPS
jgi:SAM-dependent methyltransferase